MSQNTFHDMTSLVQVISWQQQVITSTIADPDLRHYVCYLVQRAISIKMFSSLSKIS